MFSKVIAAVLCWGLMIPCGTLSAQSTSPAEARQPAQAKAVQQTTSAAAPSEPQPLTAEEEQSLSERNQEPGREVSGGALTTQQLTYIVIALAAAVLVLIFK